MSSFNIQRLREIKTFPSLVKYLRDELDWPIESEDFEELTYEYEPEELGIDAKTAVKIKEIKQLRPLSSKQPWGIFFINFEPKQLPIVVLRRILRSLVVRKRADAKKSQQAAWQLHDLLFISSYGESERREITFAHFSEPVGRLFRDLPTLRVLGWDDDDTKLKIDYVVHTLSVKLRWPKDENDTEAWRAKWSDAFELRPREVITTSKELAVRLAALAKSIRQRANLILKIESERGPLRKLHKAFQTALIHDLNEDDFADMYAQTIAYGLLSARVSQPAGIIADNLADMIPTNPFLKDMLRTFLTVGGRKGKIDFDELGIQEVVDLLNRPDTRIEAVMRDFGKKTMQEDPVVHFYELFLKEYDKKKKVERGVFYTPQPAVSYIVRSVHELLKTEFGLEDGLASIVTWSEMIKRNSAIKMPEGVSPDEPFVLILDIATGTATFLVEVIKVINNTMLAKWKKEGHLELEMTILWNEYVPKHLLPRLYGYELMMAPYAIAHMKIGLKLAETGYKFGSEERAHIYLTNSLEPPTDAAEQPEFEEMAPALAHEAKAVNKVKKHKRFTVVIGNPPYSNYGKLNKIPFILRLLDDYKRGLDEKKINLDDDFIKFIRFCQYLIDSTGVGAMSLITNNTFLDGLAHRMMRQSLLKTFLKTWIVDLHGSLKRNETSIQGFADENVFDIQQGVAITAFIKLSQSVYLPEVHFAEYWGTRETKYNKLENNTIKTEKTILIEPSTDRYYLVPLRTEGLDEYAFYWSLPNIFPLFSSGIDTKIDRLLIDSDQAVLEKRMSDILNPKKSVEDVKRDYQIPLTSTWEIERAKKAIFSKVNIKPIMYRAFDKHYTYFDELVLSRARQAVMKHMLRGKNKGLISAKQLSQRGRVWSLVGVSSQIIERCAISSNTREGNYLFPLYLYDWQDKLTKQETLSLTYGSDEDISKKHVNLNTQFVEALQDKIGNSLATPDDIFNYIYSILQSPTYRTRYAEYLKLDFPRLPLTGSLGLFKSLAKLGGELVDLHLMESPKLEKYITRFIGKGTPEVEKVSYSDETVWIDKAKSQGFHGVPENVWNFHIGGYQVCEKWLKDRKGRTLSSDDITHYHRIIVALGETIRIMAEIDKVIETHGGWPGAFQDEKAANAEYKFKPEPLLKAAEETAAYSPHGKVEVYSKSTPSLKGDWQTWLALSQWAKEKGQINTFWSDFAREISDSLKTGRKLTEKQKEEMEKCWKQAVKKGFRP